MVGRTRKSMTEMLAPKGILSRDDTTLWLAGVEYARRNHKDVPVLRERLFDILALDAGGVDNFRQVLSDRQYGRRRTARKH